MKAPCGFCRTRGFDVEQGTLTEEYVGSRAPFDAVVMLDVVERLTEPDKAIELVHMAMKPGGKLMLHHGRLGIGDEPRHGGGTGVLNDTPPQHTYFFSPRTMTAMLKRLGFEVVEYRKPWKTVPFGLIIYQLGRILGMSRPVRYRVAFDLESPLNLFDAFRLVAIRR